MNLGIAAVAPLLLWGIWICAEESMGDATLSNFPGSVGKNRLHDGYTSTLKRNPFLRTPIFWASLLLLGGALIVALGYTKSSFISIPLLAILLSTTLVEKKSKARSLEMMRLEVEAQFPQLVQVMAVLISSGISPLRAIEVISLNSDSHLGKEFAEIVLQVTSGSSMNEALDRFAQSIDSKSIRRFASSLILAIERGSPLVDVLIDQVRDARNEAKNQIQRQSGRAEIALMIPVVFLILPISVLFALWPSLIQLGSFVAG